MVSQLQNGDNRQGHAIHKIDKLPVRQWMLSLPTERVNGSRMTAPRQARYGLGNRLKGGCEFLSQTLR